MPDPKHVVLNNDLATVFTDGDMPLKIVNRTIPAYIFRDRFTTTEMDGILSAAYNGDANARRLLLKIQTATDGVDLDSLTVIGGLDYLVYLGIISVNRKAEILAY